jgi:protein SCO1/2
MSVRAGLTAAFERQRRIAGFLRIPRSYASYGASFVVLVSILAFAILQPFQVLPRIGLSPGFALTDQDGRRLTSEDLRGHIVVYNFTYTGCSPPCPQTSQTMQAVQARLPQMETDGLPVDLVTLSFDATHDTPARLRAYAAALQADLANWHFVSGDAVRLKQVIGGGFGVYYVATQGGAFEFDPTFVLVDGAGIVRARYRMAALNPDTLQRDIELIAQEAQNSHGALRLAYEAAHLFLCYPS